MAIHNCRWDVQGNTKACYSSRSGGNSLPPYDSFNIARHVGDVSETVAENRSILAAHFPNVNHWQWLEQVHGTEVLLIDKQGMQQGDVEADAIVCRVPGIACCVMTADCLPIYFADRRGGEVAIAHAGWRGLAKGVIEHTVSLMHAAREDITVYLGPAIGPCHFEVGAEVVEQFLNEPIGGIANQDVKNCFKAKAGAEKSNCAEDTKYLANLYGLANLRLKAMGVRSISGGDDCTYCQPESFYSYRRDGFTGRMLSMIYFD
jgi:polyphenol oxidase